jgi:hypothetical protein
VGLKYDSSAFGSADDVGTEVVCYGTAIVLESAADDFSKHASLEGIQEYHRRSLHQ